MSGEPIIREYTLNKKKLSTLYKKSAKPAEKGKGREDIIAIPGTPYVIPAAICGCVNALAINRPKWHTIVVGDHLAPNVARVMLET